MPSYSLPKKFPLLPRKKKADKSSYGHSLILAGSSGMSGAAVLSVRAALESGSGLVTLAGPRAMTPIAVKIVPEAMSLGLPQTKQGSIAASASSSIIRFAEKRRINAVLIGPGLSQNKETARFVKVMVRKMSAPIVLDADGLNSFKGSPQLLLKRKGALVLTPHKREFARLFGQTWPEALFERMKLAKKLSKFYDVVLVMKGHGTLVVSGDSCYMNRTGNPGMAKGGSGDVLSGMITAFIAQGLSVFLASCWAVYFHGKAADLAVKERGELGLLASDIIRFLPKAFSSRK